MVVLASAVEGGCGGVPVVNQLVLDAAKRAGLTGTIVALADAPRAGWTQDWPGAYCARGSRLRFATAALARARHARRSIVLVTHAGLIPVGRLVKHAGAARLALFIHGVEVWKTLPALTQWGLGAVDVFVANSSHTLTRFRAEHPRWRDTPGQVCYLPARLPGSARTAVERNGDVTRLRVLIVGRLWGRGLLKGHRELLMIWPLVTTLWPQAELVIVGAGEGRRELEALAASQQVSHRVRFAGAVSDEELGRIYEQSDVFAMPSRGEGFGLVFAEAMSYGIPCIASREDAGAEVVEHLKSGVLVPPGQPDELLAALTTLLSDPALRNRMGKAGQARAERLFSLSAFDRRIQNLLRGSLDQAPLSANSTSATHVG